METTPADSGPNRRQVFYELYEELALHHNAEHADRMTQALLRMESEGRTSSA